MARFLSSVGLPWSEETSRGLIYAWNNNYISTAESEFLFLLYTNRLQLNNRLTHHTDTSGACTFCELKYDNIRRLTLHGALGPAYIETETYDHFFFRCNEFKKVASRALGQEWIPDNAFGIDSANTSSRRLRIMNSSSILFKIYNCRKVGALPTISKLKHD